MDRCRALCSKYDAGGLEGSRSIIEGVEAAERKKHENSELIRIQMKHGVGSVQIRHVHVRSHIGVPCSELAGKLVTAGVNNQSPPGPLTGHEDDETDFEGR